MRRLVISALLLLLLPSLSIAADDPAPVQPAPAEVQEVEVYVPRLVPTANFRRHFELRDAKGALVYEYTLITSISEAGSSAVVLLRDPGHGDVLLENVTTVEPHVSTHRISDVKRRTFVEASMVGPFTSKTLSETFKEAHAHPELFNTATPITIATRGGEWRITDTELQDEQGVRRLRHEIRPTVDVYLLEAIERMRGTFFRVAEGSAYSWLLGQLLLYGPIDEMDLEIPVVEQAPACDFDKSFGYACSEAQLKRIREAATAGKELIGY
ncbi:MAG TPA: hypothetical protein VGF28_16465 [Thermoanaerobaculia bacterium]|jgi:hypothetical protein